MSVYITSTPTQHPAEGTGSVETAVPFALRDTMPQAPPAAVSEAPEELRATEPSATVADRRSGPFVIELRVELAAMDDVPDRAGMVLQVVAEALHGKGWNPASVVRVHQLPGAKVG